MLKLENITKIFRDTEGGPCGNAGSDSENKTGTVKKVLDNFSYEFSDTGVYALTGASGLGKTTLLRIIAGLDRDFEGKRTALIRRRDGSGKETGEAREPALSMVFQEDRLLDNLTAIENVMLVCDDREKSGKMLEALGLGAEKNSRLHTLSGGMKRRVAIARALCADFDILLMDEPFSSVDEERKQGILELIKGIAAEKCVIFVTHDIEEATALSATAVKLPKPLADSE